MEFLDAPKAHTLQNETTILSFRVDDGGSGIQAMLLLTGCVEEVAYLNLVGKREDEKKEGCGCGEAGKGGSSRERDIYIYIALASPLKP